MATIDETARTDPVETITVENNKAPVSSDSKGIRVQTTNGGSGVVLMYNGMQIKLH